MRARRSPLRMVTRFTSPSSTSLRSPVHRGVFGATPWGVVRLSPLPADAVEPLRTRSGGVLLLGAPRCSSVLPKVHSLAPLPPANCQWVVLRRWRPSLASVPGGTSARMACASAHRSRRNVALPKESADTRTSRDLVGKVLGSMSSHRSRWCQHPPKASPPQQRASRLRQKRGRSALPPCQLRQRVRTRGVLTRCLPDYEALFRRRVRCDATV